MNSFKKFVTVFSMKAGSLLEMACQGEPLRGQEIKRVEKGQYPCVASIVKKTDRYHEEALHICSGVLITNKFVLTVAHCLDTKASVKIRVILGSVDLREGKKYDVGTWITYDEWADKQNITKISDDKDIAIIKLSKKVYWWVAKPVSLSFQKNEELLNEYVVLAGWGMIDRDSKVLSRYMLEAKVKVLPNAVCENMANNISKKKISLPNEYFCTRGEPHAFLTDGDSGGPVFKNNLVVGVSKASCPKSSNCDSSVEVIDEHKSNLHVSVDFYREFIDHVLINY